MGTMMAPMVVPGEERVDELRVIAHEDREGVAGLDAVIQEEPGYPVRLLVQILVGYDVLAMLPALEDVDLACPDFPRP